MTAQVAADLRAAADVLERDGWHQHEFVDPCGTGRCASGAIIAAIAGKSVSDPTDLGASEWNRWVSANHLLSDLVHDTVAKWNDRPDRTAAEVIAALRAAADRAEGRAVTGRRNPPPSPEVIAQRLEVVAREYEARAQFFRDRAAAVRATAPERQVSA